METPRLRSGPATPPCHRKIEGGVKKKAERKSEGKKTVKWARAKRRRGGGERKLEMKRGKRERLSQNGSGGGGGASLAILEAGWGPEHSARCEDRHGSVLQPSLRFNSAGKELLVPPRPPQPPNLHSHPLPYLRTHHPIHQPERSIGEPHRSDSTTLSNDAQMGSVKYTPASASV